MKRKIQEPEYYGKARYVEEQIIEPIFPEIKKFSNKQLNSIDLVARRSHNSLLLQLVNREGKRRYMGFIMKWYRNLIRGTPKTKRDKTKSLEMANEIFRRGWNDYHDELVALWPFVEEVADDISMTLPNSVVKTRYEVNKGLMYQLVYNTLEKMQERE